MALDLYIGILEGILSEPEEARDDEWQDALESTRGLIEEINTLLVNNGCPTFEEGEAFVDGQDPSQSIPLSHYHALFVAVAKHRLDPEARASEDWDPDRDPVTDDEIQRIVDAGNGGHFLVHPVGDGYYLPVDFEESLTDGEMVVSSSPRLVTELVDAAPFLGIRLNEAGHLPDNERVRISELDGGTPLERALAAWLAYHDVARASIRNRMLLFSQ